MHTLISPEQLLFCNNDTRHRNQSSYHGAFKDAFHEYVVQQQAGCGEFQPCGQQGSGIVGFRIVLREKNDRYVCGSADRRWINLPTKRTVRLTSTRSSSERIAEADEFYADVASGLRPTTSDVCSDRHLPE